MDRETVPQFRGSSYTVSKESALMEAVSSAYVYVKRISHGLVGIGNVCHMRVHSPCYLTFLAYTASVEIQHLLCKGKNGDHNLRIEW